MKSIITLCVQFCLCFLLITMIQAGGVGISKGPKRSRLANSGLMPFPRVGRSGSMDWEIIPDDSHGDMKRSKFLQFPRVGRSNFNPYSDGEDYDTIIEKRAGNVPGNGNKNSGMWFGPRLGRLHKRSDGRFGNDGENSNNMAAYAYLIVTYFERGKSSYMTPLCLCLYVYLTELYPKQLNYAPKLRLAHETNAVQEQSEDEQEQFAGGQSSALNIST